MLKKLLLSVSLVLIASFSLTATPVSAAGCKDGEILGIPTWHRGLDIDDKANDDCKIKQVGTDIELFPFLTILVINIGDMAARAIGIASFLFIIVAGFRYVLAQAEEAKVAAAKKTLTNALIGLAISISAVVIINIIFGVFNQ